VAHVSATHKRDQTVAGPEEEERFIGEGATVSQAKISYFWFRWVLWYHLILMNLMMTASTHP
jgi:hypothetical protein